MISEATEKEKDKQGAAAQPKYICGWLAAKVGKIPRVSAHLSKWDKWSNFTARADINRMSYKVAPGLYALGNPGAGSMVLVTANYKLTFDTLRKELSGLDAWILVLDTKGINVWCAAGKGTFATDELVYRIEVSGLKEVVGHRRLIVPQLGATGVAAHEVKKRSGFSVIYGPVRACDLPAFLAAGLKATPEMRRVRFTLYDRLQLVPTEVVQRVRYLLPVAFVFFLLSGLGKSGYAIHWAAGIVTVLGLLSAFLAGTVIGPLLLPWLPGRSFSLKGVEAGIIAFLAAFFTLLTGSHVIQVLAWLLIITAISSFLTMNFTGSSTYTSLSGVRKEMRISVPLQIAGAVTGVVLWITGRFI